jgi:hypothetical protein
MIVAIIILKWFIIRLSHLLCASIHLYVRVSFIFRLLIRLSTLTYYKCFFTLTELLEAGKPQGIALSIDMRSLYLYVLNFLLMIMSFTTECLMFAFMFAAYLALTLSSVTSVNVMCMGTGAMVITTVLTALALTIAASLRIATTSLTSCHLVESPYHVFTFDISVISAMDILNALVAAGYSIIYVMFNNDGTMTVIATDGSMYKYGLQRVT